MKRKGFFSFYLLRKNKTYHLFIFYSTEKICLLSKSVRDYRAKGAWVKNNEY